MSMPVAAVSDSSAILTDVAMQFGVTLDTDRLAATVVERMVELLRAERALFALLDHTGEIEHVVHHGFDHWPGLPAPLPVSHTVIDDAITTRGFVVESAPADTGVAWSARTSARALHLRFLFAMPVQVRGQVVGVLYCDSRQAALRGIGDVESTLTALSCLVATAVDNARLWEEAAFRNLLLAQMVHDFSLPVSAIQMNVGQLLRPDGTAAEVVDVAVDIAAAATRMSEMIRTTLQLSRGVPPGSPPEDAPLIDLGALLQAQLAEFEDVRRSARLEFVLERPADLPPVPAFPDRLRSVFSNLLFNAVKFAPEGSTVSVRARLRPDAAPADVLAWRPETSAYLFRRATNARPSADTPFVEITVHSHGRPVPADARRRIFQPWTRASGADTSRLETQRPDGAGLGLAIVEQCARSMGGKVWVDTAEEGGGNSFRFTIPVRSELVP